MENTIEHYFGKESFFKKTHVEAMMDVLKLFDYENTHKTGTLMEQADRIQAFIETYGESLRNYNETIVDVFSKHLGVLRGAVEKYEELIAYTRTKNDEKMNEITKKLYGEEVASASTMLNGMKYAFLSLLEQYQRDQDQKYPKNRAYSYAILTMQLKNVPREAINQLGETYGFIPMHLDYGTTEEGHLVFECLTKEAMRLLLHYELSEATKEEVIDYVTYCQNAYTRMVFSAAFEGTKKMLQYLLPEPVLT